MAFFAGLFKRLRKHRLIDTGERFFIRILCDIEIEKNHKTRIPMDPLFIRFLNLQGVLKRCSSVGAVRIEKNQVELNRLIFVENENPTNNIGKRPIEFKNDFLAFEAKLDFPNIDF